MNVSSLSGAASLYAPRPPEAAERGPERDRDADDRAPAAPAKAAPAVGTGSRVDTWA